MTNNNGENIDEFVVDNLKLYHYLINKKCENNEDINDIKDYGLIMYIRACKSFDPNKGFKFSAYLSKTISSIINSYYSRSNNYSFYKHNISLNNTISNLDNNLRTYEELIIYKTNKFNTFENQNLIKEAILYIKNNYSNKEKQIFINHLMGMKQEDNAKLFNTNQAQISRIIKKIQLQLRKEFKEQLQIQKDD